MTSTLHAVIEGFGRFEALVRELSDTKRVDVGQQGELFAPVSKMGRIYGLYCRVCSGER